MKNLMIIGTFFALSSAAYAQSPVVCTTNVQRDPRQPTTMIRVESNIAGMMMATVQTRGGMAHFITAPHSFFISAQSRTPGVTEFVNTKEDFELVLNFKQIGSPIRGIFTGEIMGQRVQTPVVCTLEVGTAS